MLFMKKKKKKNQHAPFHNKKKNNGFMVFLVSVLLMKNYLKMFDFNYLENTFYFFCKSFIFLLIVNILFHLI